MRTIITVNRIKSNRNETLSFISVNGMFVCFGLEDAKQKTKIPGITRIPSGYYPIVLRKAGRFHQKYNRMFNKMHHGMMHITKIPNFKWVYYHMGNSKYHTAGCLLVGSGVNSGFNESITLSKSREAYQKLYSLTLEAALKGNLYINFIDNDYINLFI